MNKYEKAVLKAAEARLMQLVREQHGGDITKVRPASDLSKEAKALIRATHRYVMNRTHSGE